MLLLIGYGNPLRCDDGLGPYLVETLAGRWNRATMITSTQLTPELAEPISRAKRVVFLDAGISGTLGEVTCETVEIMAGTGAFTHNVTPASLLAAAQEWYGAVPEAILVSVAGASFDYDSAFSPTVRTLLPQIVNRVEAIITAFFTAGANA